jgi:hypothetical protein
VSDTKPITVTPEILLALHAATPEGARKKRQDRRLHDGDCQKRGGTCSLDHVWLTYVDARYVMQVLDSEVGPGNWQDEYQLGAGGKVSCRIGIFVDDRGWVWKGDGAGATDIEGDKGSFSDAFKRAAVKWGIARDLYDEKSSTTQGQSGLGSDPAGHGGGVGSTPTTVQTAPSEPQAVSPQPVAAQPDGVCPTHGTPWRTTKGNGDPAKRAYCSGKLPNGDYCDQRGPWLQAKAS